MREPQHHANRTAITLLEVLIAIGILSVGLASVFALFPAARHLSGKALNYDRSATLAENAINDFLTRGFHNPRTWVPSPLAPFDPGSRLDEVAKLLAHGDQSAVVGTQEQVLG